MLSSYCLSSNNSQHVLKTSSACFNARMARSALGLSHQFKDPGAAANGFTGEKMRW